MSWCLFGLMFLGFVSDPPGDFLVVTSAKTPIKAVSRRQLRQIWLKKLDRLDGLLVAPIQIRTDGELRSAFEAWLFLPGFNAEDYWLEQALVGGEKPPATVSNQAILMLYVARNPGFIGYISPEYRAEMKKLGLVTVRLKE